MACGAPPLSAKQTIREASGVFAVGQMLLVYVFGQSPCQKSLKIKQYLPLCFFTSRVLPLCQMKRLWTNICARSNFGTIVRVARIGAVLFASPRRDYMPAGLFCVSRCDDPSCSAADRALGHALCIDVPGAVPCGSPQQCQSRRGTLLDGRACISRSPGRRYAS